jgi:hypothetical protein
VQLQPVVAAGIVTVQVEAVPPVPTFTVKTHVPLLATILGEVPQVPMTGTVLDSHKCPPVLLISLAASKLPLVLSAPVEEIVICPEDPNVTVPVAVTAAAVTVPVNVGEASGAHPVQAVRI